MLNAHLFPPTLPHAIAHVQQKYLVPIYRQIWSPQREDRRTQPIDGREFGASSPESRLTNSGVSDRWPYGYRRSVEVGISPVARGSSSPKLVSLDNREPPQPV